MKAIPGTKGFTLLETMLVIFLIGVILAISVTMFANALPSQRVDATAREIIASFRQARSMAMTSGKWQVLTLEIDSRMYSIEGKGASRIIPDDVNVKVVDPLYGEITQGGYRFVFAPSGVSEGGTIVLSSGKKVVTLDVDPIVGAVYSQPKG